MPWRAVKLIAVLWHQGENDSRNGNYKEYYEKFDKITEALRKELDASDVPLIIGGLGDYRGKSGFGLSCPEYAQVNQELLRYAKDRENCYYVTGKGLYPNPDGIHINAESQRRFGIRYFEAYRTKSNITEPLMDEQRIVENLSNREHTISEKRYMALEQFSSGKISFDEVMKQLS